MSFLVIATVFLVQAPTAAALGATQAPSAAATKKICKVDTLDTGSRVKKRVCLTQVEWANRAEGKSANELKNLGAR